MVSRKTIQIIQEEYETYLKEKAPEWTLEQRKNHIENAFFVWSNEIVVSFWKCFSSEEALMDTKQQLFLFLREQFDEKKAEVQADFYYRELCMFKQFVDSAYGGIEKKIGAELQAETTIYLVCKEVYEQEMTLEDGLYRLTERVADFGESSHKLAILLFSHMMRGEKYTYQASTEITIYFIEQIGHDYGNEARKRALKATYENICYCYEQTGSKSDGLRRHCQAMVQRFSIEGLVFDDTMFQELTPKMVTDQGLTYGENIVKYWLYSAGNHSQNWERDYKEGIMAIGWDDIGDLSLYGSKEEMKGKMKEVYGQQYSYRNQAHATWQFSHEIKVGDIVFVKRGRKKIIGKGIVESDYYYDERRECFRNVRNVRWIENSEHDAPVPSVLKTLTEITPYTEYVKSLEFLFVDQEDMEENEVEQTFPPYRENDFLADVYMSAERYHVLKTLLLRKKNVILQGPSGVGKTYTAKRLAFSIMGEQNQERIKMIQFHQSYSYEDFLMGFRPTEHGFQLKKGPFYEFCKRAEIDSENPYFFLIDEINRGNLSKIFGELFMLIENDKRGVELQLLYSDELFSVPQNVYIIGMMNTADRSLALLDYALRRRFAFFEFSPAFESEGFIAYQRKIQNEKFDRLISVVEQLNHAIEEDESLGRGFQIGHSYFCTKTMVHDEWLHSVVEFELIPLLEEYWFDEPRKVKQWSKALKEAIV